MGMTAKEIHDKFSEAVKKETWFEYECEHDGAECVRNTEMGYCFMLTQQEAEDMENTELNTFYQVVRTNDEEISKYYTYYYDEIGDQYYAVRKGAHP